MSRMRHLHEALAESQLRLQFPVREPHREGDVVKFEIERIGDYFDAEMPLRFWNPVVPYYRAVEPQRDADGKIVADAPLELERVPGGVTILPDRVSGFRIVSRNEVFDFSGVVDLADSFMNK